MAKDNDIKKAALDSEKAEDKEVKSKAKAKDDKAKKSKDKKPKRSIVKFFKDARSEFKKVVWPTPKETTHNTVVVLIVCGLAGVYIFGIDSLFTLLNKLIFGI